MFGNVKVLLNAKVVRCKSDMQADIFSYRASNEGVRMCGQPVVV